MMKNMKMSSGGLMIKRRLFTRVYFLSQLMFLMIGCDVMENQWNNLTNSGSGSSSNSSSNSRVTSQEVPAHGQVTVSLLERSPFKGKDLDPVFWSNMEAYCKAGPTHLIIADMNLVPVQMSRAGFVARWTAQCYALATTYAGLPWSPGDDAEGQFLYDNRDQMDAWWSRYVQAVVKVMKNAPRTTAVIIVNDSLDRLGFRLGHATYRDMGPVRDRVQIGDTIQ
jgi:hypothetical protein